MDDKRLFSAVLAAGTSSRFGRTKQLARYDGMPMVTRAVRAAEAVSGTDSLLIAGSNWQAVSAACRPLLGFMVQNSEYAAGISGSLRQTISSVTGLADGLLVILADQPLVTTAHLHELVAVWQSSPNSIVASSYAETVGPPVVFPACAFAAFAALEGDTGAKSILAVNRDQLKTVACPDGAIDIDHPEDLENLRE